MWYTLVIILDIFLAWLITNSLISLFQWCFPFFPYALPVLIMNRFHIPSGFISLTMYLPNALLVGLYFMVKLPKSRAFCHWKGWEYMRRVHFSKDRRGPPYGRAGVDGALSDGAYALSERAHWPHLQGRQVIYAIAPHAIFAESVTFLFTLNPLFEGCTTIATSLLFWIPIVREFACLAGVVAANTANIAHELDAGRSIIMLPEGMRGALHVNEPNGVMHVLEGTAESEPRKGFIRCAIASNRDVCIVPVYNKGAEKTYTTFHIFPWFQKMMLKNYMYPWPIFCFGWYGSFWPKPVPIKVMVGKPIECKGKSVDEVHALYCKAMRELITASTTTTDDS